MYLFETEPFYHCNAAFHPEAQSARWKLINFFLQISFCISVGWVWLTNVAVWQLTTACYVKQFSFHSGHIFGWQLGPDHRWEHNLQTACCLWNKQGSCRGGYLKYLIFFLSLLSRNLPMILNWVKAQKPGVMGVNIITSDFVELVDFAATVIALNDLLLEEDDSSSKSWMLCPTCTYQWRSFNYAQLLKWNLL